MKKLNFLFSLLMLLGIGLGQAWAALPDNPQWEAKALADISDGATVVIISNSTAATNIALPSGATTSNPAKVACSVSTTDGVSTITPPSGKTLQDLAWAVKKLTDAETETTSWQFFTEGSTTNRMYLTGTTSNTALRIGDATSSLDKFVMGDLGKLLKVTGGNRFVGPNDNSGTDWRTYSTENASNYKGAALTFYVLQTVDPNAPSITPDPTSIDFGTHLKNAQNESNQYVVEKTLTLKQANVTGRVDLALENGAFFDAYPRVILPADWDANGEKKITVWCTTTTAGVHSTNLIIKSLLSTPEFSNIKVPLTSKILGAEIKVVDNDDPSEELESLDFGNVAQRAQASYVFALKYQRLEAGTLTLTLLQDDFSFSNGESSTTLTMGDGDGTTWNQVIRQATTTAGDYEGTLRISGCGLPTPVDVPITMTVKEPEITASVSSIDFGNVKQHTGDNEHVTKTFTLTGKYLTQSIKLQCTGSIFYALAGSNSSYYIYPNGNDEFEETIYVSCATGWSGEKTSKLSLVSAAAEDEFEDKQLVDLSVNILPTYKVRVYTNTDTWGLVSANGATPNSYSDAYVEDEDEEVTITAIPKVGYAFDRWYAETAYQQYVTIDDPYSATTTVKATEAVEVKAFFAFDCNPFPMPPLDGDPEVTYNSATLNWTWSSDMTPDSWIVSIIEHETGYKEVDREIIQGGSVRTYTATGLKADTEYDFEICGAYIYAEYNPEDYCGEGKVRKGSFTTEPYPAATLTLSENGTEKGFGSNLHVADEITLPTTSDENCIDKYLIGWSSEAVTETNTKPGAATCWDAGASYTIQSTADKLYALYATGTPGTPTNHAVFATTSLGSTNTVTNGYSVGASAGSSAPGYYQDGSGNTGEKRYVQVYVTNSETQIIANQPSAVKVTAKIGGSSAKDLGDGVYAVLLDAYKNELGTPALLTQKVEVATGKEYTVSLPIANYANVRGVRVYHLKEYSFNVRYYSIKLDYETGGELAYSAYTTACAREMDKPTFSPAEGMYTTAKAITLSSEEGDIYYTINGADPTSASTQYSEAISLSERGIFVIKAVVINGDSRSQVASATYNINLPYTSLTELVEAELPNNTTNVTVSFQNIKITGFAGSGDSRKGVYLNVKDIDGENDIELYMPSTACPSGWVAGGLLSGTASGTWTQYNSTWELSMSSEWSALTYTKPSAGLAWSASSATVEIDGESNAFPSLTNPNSVTVTYSSSDQTVATIATDGAITLLEAGTTTIKATLQNHDTYADAEVSYLLTVESAEPSISASKSSIDFGTVDKGTAVDVQTFSLTGANLTGNVKVTASTTGSVSVFSTNGNKPSGTHAPNNGIVDATIYAIPLTTTAGDFYGSLTIQSQSGDFEDIVIPLHIKVQAKEGTLKIYGGNELDFGAVKLGTTSVSTGVLHVDATKLTPSSDLEVSIDGTDDYFVVDIPSTGKISADENGKIDYYPINIGVTSTALATYGEKTATLRLHSNDMAQDSLVTLKLMVGGIVTVTPADIDLDFGDVLQNDDDSKYEKTIYVSATNLTANKQLAVTYPLLYYATPSDLYADANGNLAQTAVKLRPLTNSTVGEKTTTTPFKVKCAGTYEFSDVEIGVPSMTIIASSAITVPTISGGSLTWDGGSAPSVAKPGSTHTLVAVPDGSHENGAIVIKNGSGTIVTSSVMSGSTLTVPSYDITIVVTFEEKAKPDLPMEWKKETYTLTYGTFPNEFLYSHLTINESYGDGLTLTSSNTNVATITSKYYQNGGYTVYLGIQGVGTTTISATYEGDDTYGETTVSYTLTVQKGDPDFSFTLSDETVTEATVTYGAKNNVFPTLVNPHSLGCHWFSSNTDVATIGQYNGAMNIKKAGTTVIKAYFWGIDTYNEGEATYTLTVNKGSHNLTWTTPYTQIENGELTVDVYGSADGRQLPYVYNAPDGISVISSNEEVVTINSDNRPVLQYTEGDAVITATYTEDEKYVGEQISYTVHATDGRFTTSLSWKKDDEAVSASSATMAAENVFPTLYGASTYSLPITYSSSNEDVATIAEDGTITLVGAGSTVIKAVFAGNSLRKPAQASYTLTVNKALPGIGWSNDADVHAYIDNGKPFTLPTPVNPNNVAVTYSSSNEDAATIDENGNVTLVASGFALIVIRSAETDTYQAGYQHYRLWVCAPSSLSVSVASSSDVQTHYDAGDEFNPAGMRATLYYDNNGGDVDVSDVATWSLVQGTITESGFYTVKAEYANQTGSREQYINVKTYYVSLYTEGNVDLVVKKDGEPITSGQYFPKGTEFTVEASVKTGYTTNYKLSELRVNQTSILENETWQFTMGTNNVTVVAVAVMKEWVTLTWDDYHPTVQIGKDDNVFPTANWNPKDVAEVEDNIRYSSTNTNVATIDAVTGIITLVAPGTTTIKVVFAGSANYKAASDSYTLTVTAATYAVTITQPEHATIIVKKDGVTITSGDKFPAGTVLTVEVQVDEDYRLDHLTQHIEPYTDNYIVNNQFTLGTDDVDVRATIIQKANSGINFTEAAIYAYTVGVDWSEQVLNNPNNVGPIVYSMTASSEGIITVNAETGAVTALARGTAEVKATFAGNDTYKGKTTSYLIYVCEPTTLTISGEATKTAYVAGEEFEFDGLTATATFVGPFISGEDHEISDAAFAADPSVINASGDVNVTATWNNLSSNTLVIPVTVSAAPTGLDNMGADNSNRAVKVIRDNHLFILRGDKEYNAQGKLMK